MAKSSEYRMAIKIAGEIEKSLLTSTDLTRKELQKIAREAAKASSTTKASFSQGLKETEPFFDGLEKAGTKAFQAVIAAATVAGTTIIGIGTFSAQAGTEFESAFAGVKKTTEATAQEYAQLREEILGMTREIPASGAEISEVAEAAGQLGIAKENLLDFTQTMIDLGESTNLASTEAASALAKFANITNMSADNYGRLGSVVVGLGNNFATTESDIVSMATRIASSGELAGFTEAQILAMATAMSSVGIEAEAGGSSMSKMIKKVQVAVETGSKDLDAYADVAGMSVAKFRDAFEKDGLSAVAAFISGLNDTERNGRSATVILDELGLTQVNLSNTLLSLANADDLMYNAVETANKAWKENVALTNEAAMRYETTESKLAIMSNGFTEMGIVMYDQFNDPLREGIGLITDLVHEATDEIAGSSVIHDLAQDAMDGLPTAIRMIRETASAVADFADPFLAVGGWLADNPGLVEGTVAGLGSALLTYKAAQGLNSMATAFKSLSTASLPILGLTGAVAVISGVTVAMKKSAAEAKKANLDAHFGKISLSMQELEDVAAHILSTDSFGMLNESISELGKLDGISDSIEDAVSKLNRMNWKVSLGMELDEGEREQYKQNIASYVEDMQAYVEQEQYGINLSVGVLTGEDLEDSNIVTQLNEFYSGKSAELARLGQELNQVVTDAFQDGLLDIDEHKTIVDLQKQMADIKASLAEGSYEASLDLIGMKYAGGELNAETFQNLMSEISQQQETAKQQYEEAYLAANQAQRAMLKDGSVTQKEYEANMREIEAGYRDQIGSLDMKAADFVTGTIMQQYSDEIGDKWQNLDKLDGVLRERLSYLGETKDGVFTWNDASIVRDIGMEKLQGADRAALEELWKLAEPIYSQALGSVQNYTGAGEEIPEELKRTIMNGTSIGILSGDYDSVLDAIGITAYDNQEYKEEINKLNADGLYIPERVADLISGDMEPIDTAVDELRAHTEQQIQDVMGEDIDVAARINMQFQVGQPSMVSRIASRIAEMGASAIPGHKDGGIFDTPHIASFAEDGPEAAIPLDGSRHAVDLWKRAGEILGIDGLGSLGEGSGGMSVNAGNAEPASGSGQSQFVFSPTLQFYGNAPSRDEIEDALETEQEKFAMMMEQWIKNNNRISFAQ